MSKNHNPRVYLFFVFLLITLTPGVIAFSGGDGSSGSPYQIATCTELQAMNADLDAYYVLNNNIDCSGLHSGWGFQPIGPLFTGTFDGQNHKITNLYINAPSPSITSVGLFASTNSGAIIKNVGLIDVQITGGTQVGGLIGQNIAGIITNTYTTGSVTGINGIVGGLVGGNDNWGTITNSYSTASVTGGGNYVGGLVGYSNMETIINSYATGSVTGSTYLGGLIGGAYTGTVTNSFWDITTSGRTTSSGGTGKTTTEMKTKSTFTGASWDFTNIWQMCSEINDGYPSLKSFGVCAPTCEPSQEVCDGVDNNCDGNVDEGSVCGDGSPGNPYQIANCFRLQNMNSNLNANYVLVNDIDCSDTVNWNGGAGFEPIGSYTIKFTGTFDGQNHKIINLFINLPSTNDYVGLFGFITNMIKNVGLESVDIMGNMHVGGLVGDNSGAITNSYVTGSIKGNVAVGGLVGHIYSGTIENSYSTGSVISNINVGGGLVGVINNGGTITNSYSTASVSSNSHVGGLVGDNYGGTITNSYATGSVSGSSTFGGLVGFNSGTIINSYWDTQTSGQSTSAAGTGKTTSEMKTESTFVDWNFASIWDICEGTTYPWLMWQQGIECAPTCTPTPEICDNADNDCDALVDEDLGQTTCGLGVCLHTVDNCVGGEIQTCDPFAGKITEITRCDGLDNDCDGEVDEGVKITFYQDLDGDKYGNLLITIQACFAPTGYASSSGDCDDNNGLINPGATEIVGDNIDQNCDGKELCFKDADNDNYRLTETITSSDTDCLDSGEALSSAGIDCNDNDATIHPGATDICNNINDDCDLEVDEDYLPTTTTCGVGVCASTGELQCILGVESDSCNPGTPAADDSLCNNIDNDCDGSVDEDYISTSTTNICGIGACARNGQLNCVGGSELDSCTPGTPTAEICINGLDENCNGVADEGCYTWSGFFQPVDNLPALNQVNSGRAIPVKFSLGGDMGLSIFAAGYPISQKIACSTSAPLDIIETTLTAGGSSLSYDPVTKQYNYVWKTEKTWGGTCRQLIVKLNDGTTHTANFKFTK